MLKTLFLFACHIVGFCEVEYVPDEGGADQRRVRWIRRKDISLGLVGLTVGFFGYVSSALVFYAHPPLGILVLFLVSLLTLVFGLVERKEVMGKVAVVWAFFCLFVACINAPMVVRFLRYVF